MNADNEEDHREIENEVYAEYGDTTGREDECYGQGSEEGKVDEEMLSLQQNKSKSGDARESSAIGSEKDGCDKSKENMKQTVYNVSDSPNTRVWNNGNIRKSPITNSYAAITSKNINDTNRKLDFEPTMVEDGNEFVIFDEEKINKGSEKWKLTICRHFIGMKMPYYELKYNLVRMWGKHGLGDMFCNDNEVYCFKFKNEEAWNHKGISKLASSIGKPLIMDEMIANMCQFGRVRIGFARVLIEVDAKKPFKDGIDVQYRDNMCLDILLKCAAKGQKLEKKRNSKSKTWLGMRGTRMDLNADNKEGNKGYHGNTIKYAYRPKQTDNPMQEKMDSRKPNDYNDPQITKNVKPNRGSKGKLSTNKFVVLADYNDEVKGMNINADQRKEVDFFVQQKLQPTPFKTSKWSQDMVNYYKESWERMIDKGNIEDDTEDSLEELNGNCIVMNEIEGMSKGNDPIHQ
ncbi:hypothetical protein Tco_1524264 [Tanacetum coccineum]